VVERDDFASGTSSRSTKLIHGGVRYLEAAFKKLDIGQFFLVCEALEERSHMMKAAPFQSRPLPIVTPIYTYWQIPYFWAGIKAYDWIAKLVCCFDTGMPECFYASRANSKFLFPLLSTKGLTGSLVYYDGQQNDSRMNLFLALTAAAPKWIEGYEAASVANHCEVQKVLKDEKGQVCGVQVRDLVKNQSFELRGKVVVNCTGPFGDQIREMADPKYQKLISPAAGVHVVMPRWYAPPNFGLIIPETSDKRVLFYLPWEGNTIVGTTDTKSTLTSLPSPDTKDVEWILRESARFLSVDLEDLRRDVKSAWSGLRPLVKDPKAPADGSTAKLSRTHEIVVDSNGLVSVMGGKWTTYRRMAQDAMDQILQTRPDVHARGRCRTKNMRLLGSGDPSGKYSVEDGAAIGGRLPFVIQKNFGVSMESAEHLSRNYGFRALDLCKEAVDDGKGKKGTDASSGLSLLVPGQPFVRAEIPFAVRHEMAITIVDVLARRLRLAFIDADAAKSLVKETGDTMEGLLGWSPSVKKQRIAEAEEFLETMQWKP